MAQNFSDVCKDRSALGELGGSASDVTRALNELLNHVKDGHADRIPDIMEQVCPLLTNCHLNESLLTTVPATRS